MFILANHDKVTEFFCSVKFCDFLSVDLAPETLVEYCGNRAEVKCLKRAGYHVVIFCLLLEYLPR